MKNKIVTIILGIALLLSVGGNIYFMKTMTDTNEKVDTLSGQLVTADNEIADLQEQLTDLSALQAEVNDLQGQLTQSNTQIESLETTVAENNATISDLEEQLAEQEQSTPTSNAQTEQPSANSVSTPVPDPENSTPDANGTGSSVFIPDDDPSRGGSGDNHDPADQQPGTGTIVVPEGTIPESDKRPEGEGPEWGSGYDPNNPNPVPGMG